MASTSNKALAWALAKRNNPNAPPEILETVAPYFLEAANRLLREVERAGFEIHAPDCYTARG